jgi:hypothetical protein
MTEGVVAAASMETARRTVYDAHHTENESRLPGTLLRDEGQAAVHDESANQVYDNVGDVIQMYSKVFNWDSIDNKNAPLVSSVHFGNRYENACELCPLAIIHPSNSCSRLTDTGRGAQSGIPSLCKWSLAMAVISLAILRLPWTLLDTRSRTP